MKTCNKNWTNSETKTGGLLKKREVAFKILQFCFANLPSLQRTEKTFYDPTKKGIIASHNFKILLCIIFWLLLFYFVKQKKHVSLLMAIILRRRDTGIPGYRDYKFRKRILTPFTKILLTVL